MKSIEEHIKKDQNECLLALSEHNDGKVRHPNRGTAVAELRWLSITTINVPATPITLRISSCSVSKTPMSLMPRLLRLSQKAIS